MHTHDLTRWTHAHRFDAGNRAGERGTWTVMAITAAMMLVELWAGWWYGSMALLADGLHMGSHTVAIGLSAVAYAAARRYADDPRFAFGAWKIEVLAGFASSVLLMVFAAMMVAGSLERLAMPREILYAQAMAVAVAGLVVNLVCAVILHRADGGHRHSHGDGAHGHHAHDLNLRSAYLHVLADAATSALAIVALAGGMAFGWNWLDPLMGIVGGALVMRWALGLARDSARVLLDSEMDHPVARRVKASLNAFTASRDGSLVDFHLWRVGKDRFACILGLVTHDPELTPAQVKAALRDVAELAHVTVELERCPGATAGTGRC